MDGQNATAGDKAEESKGPARVETPQESKSEEIPLSSQKSAASAEPEYPGPVQVALIMMCILCAIFIMSLVSFPRVAWAETQPSVAKGSTPNTTNPVQHTGPHDHLDRDPPDHR